MEYVPSGKGIIKGSLSFSIVLETENLGMAGMQDLCDTLSSLQQQTCPITNAREILVLAAGHVTDETLNILRTDYPWLIVHRETNNLEYLESKQRGAQLVTGDIVVFADSDVVYETTWLESLLSGFALVPGATIVAGDTRIRGTSVYATAIQLMWMMHTQSIIHYSKMITHFDLNNFAIRRPVMLSAPLFTDLPLYRAHTVEMKKILLDQGYSAVRVPGTRGYHLPPGSFVDYLCRLMVYGADAVAKAEYSFHRDGTAVRTPSWSRRLVRIPVFLGWKIVVMTERVITLLREDWRRVGTILLALPVAILSLCVAGFGCVIALFSPQYMFRLVTAREHDHVV